MFWGIATIPYQSFVDFESNGKGDVKIHEQQHHESQCLLRTCDNVAHYFLLVIERHSSQTQTIHNKPLLTMISHLSTVAGGC